MELVDLPEHRPLMLHPMLPVVLKSPGKDAVTYSAIAWTTTPRTDRPESQAKSGYGRTGSPIDRATSEENTTAIVQKIGVTKRLKSMTFPLKTKFAAGVRRPAGRRRST